MIWYVSRFLLIFMGVVMCATSLVAEDIWDPPWEEDAADPRWDGGTTTYQRWEFNENPDFPVECINEFGNPSVDVENGTYPDPVLGPDDQTEINTWHIGPGDGGIWVYVPNDPRPNAEKVIFVQITSDKGSGPNSPITTPAGTVSYPKPDIQHGGTWYTYTAQIDLPFNPPEEWIWYDFPESTNISEIVVDTICVPEPSTLVMLAVGAFGLLICLRRRRR